MDTADQETKSYEISFLLDAEEDAREITDALQRYGAVVGFGSPVQKIRLAYEIQKRTSACFGYVHFQAEPHVIPELIASLRLDKKVIRFLVVSPITVPRPAPMRRPQKPVERPSAEQPETKERTRVSERPAAISNEALEKTLEEILK